MAFIVEELQLIHSGFPVQASGGSRPADVPALVRSSAGQPLGPGVRATLEQHFSQPLGHIRVHTDRPAQQAATRLGADAFAYGRDIFLGKPGKADMGLLAHEVTHVLQQQAGARSAIYDHGLQEQEALHHELVARRGRRGGRALTIRTIDLHLSGAGASDHGAQVEGLVQLALGRAMKRLRRNGRVARLGVVPSVRCSLRVGAQDLADPTRAVSRLSHVIERDIMAAVQSVFSVGARPGSPQLQFKKKKPDANHFKAMIEQERYPELAEKLAEYIDVDRCGDKILPYVQGTLDYLQRGGKLKSGQKPVYLVRGVKNDKVYDVGAGSYMLPNRINHQRTDWDTRLKRINDYFGEATAELEGSSWGSGYTQGKATKKEIENATFDLDKIIYHHKGGGTGTSANSVRSVLISASIKPLSLFGPPFMLLKVAPERCIFNYQGLSSEYEVLLPFFILPSEVVGKFNSVSEVENHPEYKSSNWRNIGFNQWGTIEENIRMGRDPQKDVKIGGGGYW